MDTNSEPPGMGKHPTRRRTGPHHGRDMRMGGVAQAPDGGCHLQDGNQQVVARIVGTGVHLQPLCRLVEGAELRIASGNKHTLAHNERHGLDSKTICRGNKEVCVGENGVLGLRVLRSGLNLFNLLTSQKVELHKILYRLALLNGGREKVYPQNIIVAEFIKELDVGFAHYFVVLFEVNCNHCVWAVRI